MKKSILLAVLICMAAACADELRGRFESDVDKSPIFRGELGIYQGVTIHDHK